MKGNTLKLLTGTCYVCGAKLELGGTPNKGYKVRAHHRQLPKGTPVAQLDIPTPNCSGSDMPPVEKTLTSELKSTEKVTVIRTVSY